MQIPGEVYDEKWVYTWNPRNQMTLAEKFSGTNDTYAGKVAYIYCLTCDGALSQRIEYHATIPGTIIKWNRYEYDGLNLLRVDERYDTGGGAIDDQDPWRKKEVSTHKPGSLGNLLGKMVYFYTGANQNTDTPSASYFYAYFYDAVGNLLWTVDNSGYLNYTFSQDAFGNELSVSPFSGTPWSSARTYCANEHQTGKWIDPFTGLYFFHARWYDSGVGRFVSQEIVSRITEPLYVYVRNNPIKYYDVNGLYGEADPPYWQIIGEMFFPSDPNADQGAVDCFLRHRRDLCAIAGNSTICHLPDINVSEWVDEAENGIGSCVSDTACCFIAGAALEKTAGELFTATLKRNKSFYSDLADLTLGTLQAMCKAGDHRACQMVKLIKRSPKLNCKIKEAGRRFR